MPDQSSGDPAFLSVRHATCAEDVGRVSAIPADTAGRWGLVEARLDGDASDVLMPSVVFADADGQAISMRHFLGPVTRDWQVWRSTVYVPADAAGCRFMPMTAIDPATAVAISLRPLTQIGAVLRILRHSWKDLPKFARLALTGRVRRARTLLITMAAVLHRQKDYGLWMRCFDLWPPQPPPGTTHASVAALVFQHDPSAAAPLAATVASLAAQGVPMPHAVLAGRQSAGWRGAAAGLSADYVALLQSGEVLPPHAGWLAGAELHRLGNPAIAFTDQDALQGDSLRERPDFRPSPNRLLMLSGTQTRGVWFVRRDVLLAQSGQDDPEWAECLRLDLWLRWYEGGGRDCHRIPVVLTHRRADTEAAPGDRLAAAANAHLSRTGMTLRVEPGFPMIVRSDAASQPRVSILVPSALRSALAGNCLESVLAATAYDRLDLAVGVSQPDPLGTAQRQVAARLEADSRARVMHLARPVFNFSETCNTLAAATDGELILLLNDDVSVIAPAWLQEMVAHLGDPAIGIVGAKLLYPDRTVQHGGVIMGLTGLCDHADRHRPPGTHRTLLARELSAVTAACMLVRRSVFEQVGGLDPAYPSAFNDVDFCLRVREAGYGVAFAAAAELVHHEMQTYGSHYSGWRAPFQAAETARLRRRWAAVIADDPFHNPNLGLAPGWECYPAFPPRGLRSPAA